MTKTMIRKKLLARRSDLSAEECRVFSEEIQRRFLETPLFRRSRVVGLYSPVRNEVLTSEIFHAAAALGKGTAYPRVRDCSLEFIEVRGLADLQVGAFGIREPRGERRVALNDFDLLIVPGVVFDREGGRLGYGKGYYDRFLAGEGFRGKRVGLCYELQLVPLLPRERHDVLMDVVITEQRIILREDPTGSSEEE